MEGSKIKSIIIIILAIANVFLLGLLLTDSIEAKSTRLAAERNVREVFDQNGINLPESLRLSGYEPMSYTLRRDVSNERKIIKGVLGSTVFSDLGGNIHYYESEKGVARFHGGGEFEIFFSSVSIAHDGEPEAVAATYMKKLGMGSVSEEAVVTQDGEYTSVELHCSFNDMRIYNSSVKFGFYGGYLLEISGMRNLGAVASSTDGGVLDVCTVLMRFLDGLKREGYVCSEIRAIELGFEMQFTVSGENTLTPVWRIETDTGEGYIHGITGDIISNLS